MQVPKQPLQHRKCMCMPGNPGVTQGQNARAHWPEAHSWCSTPLKFHAAINKSYNCQQLVGAALCQYYRPAAETLVICPERCMLFSVLANLRVKLTSVRKHVPHVSMTSKKFYKHTLFGNISARARSMWQSCSF